MKRSSEGVLVTDLRRRDVRLTVVGTHIRVDAPQGILSDDQRLALRSYKDVLRSWLGREARLLAIVLVGYLDITGIDLHPIFEHLQVGTLQETCGKDQERSGADGQE